MLPRRCWQPREAYSVEANACCPGTKVAIEKVSPAMPMTAGVSCKGNAYDGWSGASTRNAAWTGIKRRRCTCEGYASASIARTAVTTTMVVEAPGVVTKSALHPPLPKSVAMINVPEAAEMVNLAPTISKASAATFMIEEIGDYGLDSPSSRSPITPPAMPLIAHNQVLRQVLSELFRRREIRTTSRRC